MSSKGKRRYVEPHDSDDDYASRPKKNAAVKRQDEENDSGDIVVCQLSKNRRVSVRSWQGKVVVDIREFYMKDGKAFPGKKGISLSMDQWKILTEHVPKIDQAFADDE